MTLVPPQGVSPDAVPDNMQVRVLARRLAVAGLSVECSPRRDGCELTIAEVSAGKSCLSLTVSGQACWHYEPATGPSTHPSTLTAIISYLLATPDRTDAAPGPDVYQAFPLKGQVGRMLQDRGLTVALRVTEDWESFEATTDIDITSPAHPRLGTVSLSDNADLDWCCDWQAAFHGNSAALIDVIIPILRSSIGNQIPATETATEIRRNVLRMELGAPDGIDVARQVARER